MKEYTAKQIKQLEKNPYVFKVTKHMIYYTAKFKEDFWVSYQAGNTPRKILEDFGFDLSIFRQKQIDSLVQHIKKQALAGEGFSEGANRKRRIPPKPTDIEELAAPQSIERMQNELSFPSKRDTGSPYFPPGLIYTWPLIFSVPGRDYRRY